MKTIHNVHAWVDGVSVAFDAVNQVRNLAGLPILAGHVAVMPDVHLGKGATVGTVLPTAGAIIPAAVGVDIGCGMAAVKTNLRAADLPYSLAAMRSTIEAAVPVGFSFHKEELDPTHEGADGQLLRARMTAMHDRFERLDILAVLGQVDAGRIWKQVGTLGGGNHFIEVCLDEVDGVWCRIAATI